MANNIREEIFWGLSPKRLEPYKEAENIRKIKRNSEMWIQGIYFMNAIGACFSKDAKYPNNPIDFFKEKTKEDEMKDWERFKCNFVGEYEKQPEHVE